MEGMQGKVGYIREGYHTPKEGGMRTSTGRRRDQYW